jgi:hypothetical protein
MERAPMMRSTTRRALAGAGACLAAVLAAGMAERGGGMDSVAESYVKLVLAVGQHDADYVDAFYGPAEWKTEAESKRAPLPQIRERAEALIAALGEPPRTGDEIVTLRHRYLKRQLQSLASRADILSGARMSFDEESKALYDAVAPTHTEAEFQAVLDELSAALPGNGALLDRYAAWREAFTIPRDRFDRVLRAAIDACRERTMRHVDLPPAESFTLEYVTGKPWSGYNWYKGGSRSLIQINTDLPKQIDDALDLACHEGYPGHHVYNVLLEQALVRGRGWIEFTVYPLFSPQSLIAEGTANYGIDVAFPAGERVRFDREVLFPLAGLDPARAEGYRRIQQLRGRLTYADNEAARRYLDGRIEAAAAAEWLTRYALTPRDRAEQRVRFFDTYRSYVINYNLGKDLVARYVESRGGSAERPQKRWEEFRKLLASPRLPGALRGDAGA